MPFIIIVTKRRDLQPPKSTYNLHLRPSTTTSKNWATTYNQFKNIFQPPTNKWIPSDTSDKCLKQARSQCLTSMKFEKWTKPQPLPRILLSTVPLDNQLRAKVTKQKMRGHSIYILYSHSSKYLQRTLEPA